MDGRSLGRETGEPRQLELVEDDSRLPWLEGDDGDEYAPPPPPSGIWLWSALALLMIAVVGGIGWWVVFAGQQPVEVAAEGELIRAPEGPYKVRPDDPGGELVAGTGDTSYRVAEGEAEAVRIAPAVGQSLMPGPAQAGGQLPAVAVVQVGAFASKEEAEAGWLRLVRTFPPLGEHNHRVMPGRADFGTVFRLQVLSPDAAAANALCAQLREAGLACQVKR
jgi:hypothetical protein